jgi:hypothetical protein
MSIQIVEWEGEREGAKERQWKREIGRQRESEGERERTFFGTKSKHVYQGIAAQGTAQVLFRHGSSSSYDTHQKQGTLLLLPLLTQTMWVQGLLDLHQRILCCVNKPPLWGGPPLHPSPPPPSSSSLRPDVLEVLSFLLPLYYPLCGCF